MRQKVNLVCDKCRGPVWRDVEFHSHIELSCLYCGKLWFVKTERLEALVKRKVYESTLKNAGGLIVA